MLMMPIASLVKPSARRAGLCGLVASALLSACVIVPLDPKTGQPYPYAHPNYYAAQQGNGQPNVVVLPQAAPQAIAGPTVLNGRLYPVSDTARASGVINASAVDMGNGRSTFNVNYLGQSLQGESTRVDKNFPGFGRILSQVQGGYNWAGVGGQRGIANAAAGSGVSMQCEFVMTNTSQGVGACVMSDGAKYQLHFGA
jgi:hypothetical protein